MKQVGAFPASQLGALEEVTTVVRQLLRGQRVTFDGSHVQLRDVQLDFPPANPPIVQLGVRGPKSLQLAGRAADGTIIAELVPPSYVAWAKEQIRIGQYAAGREAEPHHITLYVHCIVTADRDAAAAQLAPIIAGMAIGSELSRHLAPLGVFEPIADLIAAGDVHALAADMPADFIAQFAVIGTPEQCRASINAFAEAGADSVVLVPVNDDLQTLATIARDLLPLLRA